MRLLTGLRAIVSLLTFALAALGLTLGSLPAVFLGLLIAELASALVFEFARRRHLARAKSEAAEHGRGVRRMKRVLVDLLFFTGKKGGMESYARESVLAVLAR